MSKSNGFLRSIVSLISNVLRRGNKANESIFAANQADFDIEEGRDSRCTDAQAPSNRSPTVDKRPVQKQFLLVGLDIGTSCTKVCVRDPGSGNHYFVDFEQYSQAGHPNLVDTSLIATAGSLSLPTIGEHRHRHENLKLALLNDSHTSNAMSTRLEDEVLFSAYAALVLRFVVAWLNRQPGVIDSTCEQQYVVNLGIPSSGWADSRPNHTDEQGTLDNSPSHRLMAAYRLCALVGWTIAFSSDSPITQTSVRDAMAAVRPKGNTGIRELFEHCRKNLNLELVITPEVIAALLPIRRSGSLNHGLHMLIDVGRGTMDLMVFRVGPDRLVSGYDTRYTLLWCDVPLLGTAYTLVPGVNVKDVQGRIAGCLRSACIQAKTKDPNAEEWTTKGSITAFVMGGGSSESLYSRAILNASLLLSRDFHGVNGRRTEYLNARVIGQSDVNLDRCFGYSPHDVHRLIVAFGLSYEHEDIGGITDVRGELPKQLTFNEFELNTDLY